MDNNITAPAETGMVAKAPGHALSFSPESGQAGAEQLLQTIQNHLYAATQGMNQLSLVIQQMQDANPK